MSLQVQAQVSLQAFNTFGVDVRAQLFAEAHNDDDVREALAYAASHDVPLLVIGGGSNLLLTADIPALVLRMVTRGIRLLSDDGNRVVIEAEAGEPWHPFVQYTLAQGLAGLENLSLIPGTVGAAPMQNIGAYGVEIKDVFAGLTALDRESGELRDFSLEDCNFGYRDSLFKQQPGRWLILRVRFTLDRAAHLHLVSYPQADGQMKLAAGWLIERAGWKGFRDGDAGVHKLQALVLVNYGTATGLQLLDLAQRIQKDIAERFHVELEMEPNRY